MADYRDFFRNHRTTGLPGGTTRQVETMGKKKGGNNRCSSSSGKCGGRCASKCGNGSGPKPGTRPVSK